jgi:hypothetical protein
MSENSYVGYLRFLPGWYLEATVDVSGKKQKFGICDGNADMHLGQAYKTGEYTSDGEKYWYFSDGDTFVLDSDGSGKFEKTPFNNESCAFGQIAYFGAQPCKVTLAADYKSVQIEPWAGKIVEMSLQPQGDQVRSVTLAWEKAAGQWQLIKPTLVNGKAQVPAGNYRLYQCVLAPQTSVSEQVLVSGYNRKLSDPVAFDEGKANSLRCGGPLEIKVTAKLNRDRQVIYEKDGKGNQVPRIITPTNDYVRINGVVVGAGGEIYSSFGKGKDYAGAPPKPTYAIIDAKGKELTSGNLEFG